MWEVRLVHPFLLRDSLSEPPPRGTFHLPPGTNPKTRPPTGRCLSQRPFAFSHGPGYKGTLLVTDDGDSATPLRSVSAHPPCGGGGRLLKVLWVPSGENTSQRCLFIHSFIHYSVRRIVLRTLDGKIRVFGGSSPACRWAHRKIQTFGISMVAGAAPTCSTPVLATGRGGNAAGDLPGQCGVRAQKEVSALWNRWGPK